MLNLNLLPGKEKEEFKLELTFMFLVEFGSRMVFLALIVVALFFSVYLYSSTLYAAQLEQTLVQRDMVEEDKFKEIEKNVQESNAIVERIWDLERNFFIFSKTIEDFIPHVPAKVYLKSFSLSASTRQITLTGFAPTREEMLLFKKNLEESREFSEIYSPLSNLLVPKEVNFTFTLTVKK